MVPPAAKKHQAARKAARCWSCHHGELFQEDIDAPQVTVPAIFHLQNLSQYITE
jgi:nitrate reductase cytochrome c-type subunit